MSDDRAVGRAWIAVGVWVALELTATSLPGNAIPSVGFDVDDIAHVTMYAVMGFLVGRALARGGAGHRAMVLAWPALVAFAVLDEWHQRFIPGRYPSMTDGLADAFGAALGLGLAAILLRTRWAAWIR